MIDYIGSLKFNSDQNQWRNIPAWKVESVELIQLKHDLFLLEDEGWL